ncbi:MAG TPA: hypothetical protein VGN25_10365 [Solirubrobacteraceae bacterium]|jgi:hypothetical protein|nr:hypothetical protein [Solirubrobacteraceae bacterium]
MRTVPRRRHYLPSHWLMFLTPVFGYSDSRDAYVLRLVGRRVGPVLRTDRRVMKRRHLDGPDRRRAHAA